MDDDQQFCLRWNNHQSTLISVFDTLLENGTLVDCTLAAEGKFLKAHKVVLSACSPYFAALLSQQYDKHPIFILKDVKFQELRAMMDYMYRGEVNISQDQLAALLKAAESLQIKGLSDSRGSGSGGSGGSSSQKADTSTKLHGSVPAAKTSTGLTIEQKRPRIEKHPATIDMEPDVSDSREGSTSPNSRKRKKVRRRSIETNNIGDNHDQHSNSSSHSMPHAASSTHSTSMPTITSATSSASVLNVTKKTDHHQSHDSKGDIERDVDDNGDDGTDGGDGHHQQPQIIHARGGKQAGMDSDSSGQQAMSIAGSAAAKDKMEHSTHQEMLLEPKNEYDESNEGNVEDLTLDDEELLDDLEQAGPSHGGEGSSQGYAQWQIERSQDEVFMGGQDSTGQHRDAQGDNDLGGGLTMIKLEPTSPTNTPPHYTSYNYSLNITTNRNVWTTTNANNPPPPLWRPTLVTSNPKTGVKSIIIKRQPISSPEENKKPSSTTTTSGDFNNSAIRLKKEEQLTSHDDILYIGGEKPWICRNCNRNYKWKNSLKCHLKNECGLPPKYFCSRMCGYKTNIHSNLKRHLNSKFCKNRDLIKADNTP